MNSGIIEKDKNPFAIPSWIKQGYGLTFKSKRNRQEKLQVLFNKTIEKINEMDPNEGNYPAFVGIRWGFAEIKDNKIVPTKVWDNRLQYDKYGEKIKKSR
jgi:hypothetical protein